MKPVIIGDAELWLGDCIEVMRAMPDASVDSIVTDPPYELGFMGKAWDSTGIANSADMWREALRVLKPGGHLLAFSGSRTYHRMTCAIEDAGFEIRDQIMWIYGSGFPKSMDVSKAIDKARRRDYVLAAVELGLTIPGNNLHDWTKAGHAPGDIWWNEFKQVLSTEQWGAIERAVVGQQNRGEGRQFADGASGFSRGVVDLTAPATEAAQQWDGWGTALKPAHEPICMARKPLIGTVAANVLAHGTGAINIDACRIDAPEGKATGGRGNSNGIVGWQPSNDFDLNDGKGRWPANAIHDGLAEEWACFFYCAKASREDRNEGCDAFDKKPLLWSSGTQNPGSFQAEGTDRSAQNNHPTVKPVDLMAYLCRLVTPPGGVILDPFMGSGSTGKAAIRENFKFIGIDMTPEYVAIAKARIEHEQAQPVQERLFA